MMLFVTHALILASIIGGISCSLNVSGHFNADEVSIIHTKNGPVKGYVAVSRDGRDYFAYVGILYAKPPVGNLRFEAPVPVGSWENVYNANNYAPDCFQFDAMVRGEYMGSEDCLYLNIFIPKQPTTNFSLPVMVYIHGGAFFSGGAAMYDPKYFMDEDVIMVSMNYRLGPLGFLNTGDGIIRGNMGLKDQNLAMRWVKNNIDYFGGDEEEITIFGESAGAASVHYHIISPASKNLFHKAILQSGAITCPWAFTNNPRRQASIYSGKIGCPMHDTSAMTRCLKKKSLKELFVTMVDLMIQAPFNDQEQMFAPSKEAVTKEDTFLSENPRILLEEGKFTKVPVIMGVTSGEGALRTARLEANNLTLDEIDKNWNTYCPKLLIFDPKRVDVSQRLRQYYFSDEPFSSDPDRFFMNFTTMMSDGWFFHSIHNAAYQHSKSAPVFMYFYDYDSSLPGIYSTIKAVKPNDYLMSDIKIAYSIAKDWVTEYLGYQGGHDYGACHADDLLQLWKIEWMFEIGNKSTDYKFSKTFVKSFVDFAKNEVTPQFSGNNWPAIDSSPSRPFTCMLMDKIGDGGLIKEPFAKRLPFLNSLNIRNWRQQDW